MAAIFLAVTFSDVSRKEITMFLLPCPEVSFPLSKHLHPPPSTLSLFMPKKPPVLQLTHVTTTKKKNQAMKLRTNQRKRISAHLPCFNSKTIHNHNQFYKVSVLPFFAFLNLNISCGISIYRAYTNGNISMMAFITFVYFATCLMDYLFRLYHKLPPSEKSPKKLNLKIGYWVLLSAIMLGFAYKISTCMSLAASLSVFGIAIGGSAMLFNVYFVWDGDMGCSAYKSTERRRSKRTRSVCTRV